MSLNTRLKLIFYFNFFFQSIRCKTNGLLEQIFNNNEHIDVIQLHVMINRTSTVDNLLLKISHRLLCVVVDFGIFYILTVKLRILNISMNI